MRHFFLFFLFTCSIFSVSNAQRVYSCKQDLIPVRHSEKKLYGYADLFGNWVVRPYFDQANYFSEGLAIVKKRSRYGVINCDGKVLLRVEYDEIKDFVNGFSWVRKGDLWGLVDFSGKTILEPEYDQVENISKFSDYAWLKTEGKWGVFDKEKVRFVHAPKFSSYQLLNDKTSLVELSEKKGMINHRDSIFILEPVYTSINKFAPYLLEIKKDNKVGVVSDYGKKILSPKYNAVYDLDTGRFSVELEGKQALLTNRGYKLTSFIADSISPFKEGKSVILNDGLFSYLNVNGKKLFGSKFKYASIFRGGEAIVKTINDNKFYFLKETGDLSVAKFDSLRYQQGYYVGTTKRGEVIILPNEVDEEHVKLKYRYIFNDPLKHVRVKTMINDSMRVMALNYLEGTGTKYYYDSIDDWDEGGNALVSRGNKKGLINNLLIEVIPTEYSELVRLEYDNNIYFKAKKNREGYVLFDVNGKAVIKDRFDKIAYAGRDRFIIQDSETKFSKVVDTRGNELLSTEFFDLQYNYGSKSYIGKDKKGKLLLISASGEVLSKKYSGVVYLGQDRFSAWKKAYETVLNGKGEVVIPKSLLNFSSHEGKELYVVQLNMKFALAGKKGELITPYVYQEIYPFYGGFAVAKKGDFYGIITRKGKVKHEFEFENFKIAENFYSLSSDNESIKLFLSGEIE